LVEGLPTYKKRPGSNSTGVTTRSQEENKTYTDNLNAICAPTHPQKEQNLFGHGTLGRTISDGDSLELFEYKEDQETIVDLNCSQSMELKNEELEISL
jgi:hypothetical protein